MQTGGDVPTPWLKIDPTCGPARGLAGRIIARNAVFAQWLTVEHAIHFLPGAFEGDETHDVSRGQPLVLGFEWEGGNSTVDELDAAIIGDLDHDLRVVLDGANVPGDWKQYYQPAFFAKTQCGPAWSWDHDGDGPGDGNGNGVWDFEGSTLFWRAPLGAPPPGTYVLTVDITFDGWATFDTIPGGTIVVR